MPDTNEETAHPPIVPLMPSGNGVTDLEVSREQEAVAKARGIVPREQPPMDDAVGGTQAEDVGVPLDENRPTLSE